MLGFGFVLAVASAAPVPSSALVGPPVLRVHCAELGERTEFEIIDTDPDGVGEAISYCRNVLGGHVIAITRSNPPAEG